MGFLLHALDDKIIFLINIFFKNIYIDGFEIIRFKIIENVKSIFLCYLTRPFWFNIFLSKTENGIKFVYTFTFKDFYTSLNFHHTQIIFVKYVYKFSTRQNSQKTDKIRRRKVIKEVRHPSPFLFCRHKSMDTIELFGILLKVFLQFSYYFFWNHPFGITKFRT